MSAASFTFLVVFLLDRNYRVLPNAIHGYMPSHHPGLVVTDVTIATCSSLNLFSSCDMDPKKWHRLDKDLYLGKTWISTAYIFVSRKHEEELTEEDKVVVGVSVGRLQPAPKGESDERWEKRPNGLWIKRSAKPKASDSNQAVTDIDVVFGDDAVEARDGWAITGTPLLLKTGGHLPCVQVSVRQGPHREIKKPVPRIRDNGRFKILQISDLHLSTGLGKCRDPVPDSYNGGHCEADPRTLDFVTRILDEEKPDFVVLSGDQVNGDTAPDAPTVSPPTPHPSPGSLTFSRLSTNGRLSWSSGRFRTLPFLAIMMMRKPCPARLRWLSWSRSHTPSLPPAPLILTAWATTTSRFLLAASRTTPP